MDEYLVIDVVVERYSPGVLIFHDGDEVDADDISVLTVESPGVLHNATITVAVPSADTDNYDFFIAKIPTRKEMWGRLKVPHQHLVVEVRADAVAQYMKVREGRSLLPPSVDVFAFKRIENRPSDAVE